MSVFSLTTKQLINHEDALLTRIALEGNEEKRNKLEAELDEVLNELDKRFAERYGL